jgi:hypothetical protein
MAGKTLVDRFLDADDTEPMELFTDDGDGAEFEQIAVLMHEETPYVILRPMDGKENEVLVFEFLDDDEETVEIVDDRKLAQSVLDEYKKKIKELKVQESPAEEIPQKRAPKA